MHLRQHGLQRNNLSGPQGQWLVSASLGCAVAYAWRHALGEGLLLLTIVVTDLLLQLQHVD